MRIGRLRSASSGSASTRSARTVSAHGSSSRLLGRKRLLLDELAKDYLRDYEINRGRSLFAAEAPVKRLKDFFGTERAVDITTDAIRRYIAHRQAEKAAAGTISREIIARPAAGNLREGPR